MRSRRPPLHALVPLLLCLSAAPAVAHPHVFIDQGMLIRFEDGQPRSVRLSWTFDEVFSAAIAGEFDRDGDGSFSKAESATIEKAAFVNLASYGYFTSFVAGSRSVRATAYRDFVASLSAGRLTYEFSTDLPAPLAGATRPYGIRVYDDEFFVAFAVIAPERIRLEGAPPGARVEIEREARGALSTAEYAPARVVVVLEAP
ncbi:MAG: DUF1007 family protein [Spirochaetales bacterium]|nr:DUF1007 family protein [Spirochaetales bacterium]